MSSLRSRPSFNHVGVCEEHWFANKDVCWAFVGRSPSSPTWSASRYTYKSNMKVEHGIFGITPKKCYMTGQNHVHSRFCVCVCVVCVCLCVLALSRGFFFFFPGGDVILTLFCSITQSCCSLKIGSRWSADNNGNKTRCVHRTSNNKLLKHSKSSGCW